jgi:hypothetical protein
MALNHNHSGSWSEVGFTGNNVDSSAGSNTDSLSWTDIQRSLDQRSGGSGSTFNTDAGGTQTAGTMLRSGSEFPLISSYDAAPVSNPHGIQGSLPHMHGNEFSNQQTEGFGLAQAGVSPFRGIDATMNGDFFNSARRSAEALTPSGFQPSDSVLSTAPVMEGPVRQPRLNSSLLRVIGNLQKQNAEAAPREVPPGLQAGPAKSDEAKLAIGLAIAPGDEKHEPGSVARAKVRLEQEAALARLEARKAERAPQLDQDDTVQAKLEQQETRPLADPFRHVFEQHAKINEKFDGSNCKYGRTTLLPDGRTVTSSTASDNTTLTKTTGESGFNSMVVHDRYRRPVTEQETRPDGTWSFSELSYDDSKGIKPFCAEKITVNSDGTMVLSKYSTMGQLESKQLFA